jgi:hypothetical protein
MVQGLLSFFSTVSWARSRRPASPEKGISFGHADFSIPPGAELTRVKAALPPPLSNGARLSEPRLA